MRTLEQCREDVRSAVTRAVAESGDPRCFDAEAWTDSWMNQRVPALGNVTPTQYLLSGRDCQDIVDIVLRMQSGAFS